MSSAIVLVPLAAAVVFFVFSVARTFLRIWLEHRFRRTLLARYQKNPALFGSEEELKVLLERGGQPERPARQDYAYTGVFLALIGVCAIVAGNVIGLGTLAVGLNAGGILCAVLGVLIALLGVLINTLQRVPALPDSHRD